MNATDFVAESNRIEGIHRPPTDAEVNEFERFIALDRVTVEDMQAFVKVYQPGAVLRERIGLDVRVGNHYPPRGAPHIRQSLQHIVETASAHAQSPYVVHARYEMLHPFTDGNGRSGRMLWAWQVGSRVALSLGFLHRWYYQSLDAARV